MFKKVFEYVDEYKINIYRVIINILIGVAYISVYKIVNGLLNEETISNRKDSDT